MRYSWLALLLLGAVNQYLKLCAFLECGAQTRVDGERFFVFLGGKDGEYFEPWLTASKTRVLALLWELKYLKMSCERKVRPGIAQPEVSLVAVTIERNGNAERQTLTRRVFQLGLKEKSIQEITHP